MIIHVFTNPVISLQLGMLGILRGGKQLCQGDMPGTGKLIKVTGKRCVSARYCVGGLYC